MYVAPGSPQFSGPSLLVSEYGADNVAAYDVDGDGDPIVATQTGLHHRDSQPRGRVRRSADRRPSVLDLRRLQPDRRGPWLRSARLARGPDERHQRRHRAAHSGRLRSARRGGRERRLWRTEARLGGWRPGRLRGRRTYTVSVDAMPHYGATIAGDCAPDGTVVIPEGVQPVAITVDDEKPTAALRLITKVEGGTAAERLHRARAGQRRRGRGRQPATRQRG